MGSMFSRCKTLETINISNFNTINVTDMNSMFNECNKLTSIDLSSFNTSNVTNMGWMFYNCKALETINIGCNWKTANSKTDMFYLSNYTQEQFNKLVEDKQATCPTNETTS
jgi:surface protein